jgi:hypothetical protein
MNAVAVFSGLFFVAWILVVAGGAVNWWLLARLHERHLSTYERLGSPKLIGPWRPSWEFLKFIWSSEWRYLNDSALASAVFLARVVRALFVALILMCYVIFFQNIF